MSKKVTTMPLPLKPAVRKTIRLTLEKVTPGALRYVEIGDKNEPRKKDIDGAVLGMMYVRKAGFGPEAPAFITVTIDW